MYQKMALVKALYPSHVQHSLPPLSLGLDMDVILIHIHIHIQR